MFGSRTECFAFSSNKRLLAPRVLIELVPLEMAPSTPSISVVRSICNYDCAMWLWNEHRRINLIFCIRDFFEGKLLCNVSILYGKEWTILAMINLTKELPQNRTVVQSEHTEQYSKVPMTASSSGSFWIASEHNCGSSRTYGAAFKSSNDSAI